MMCRQGFVRGVMTQIVVAVIGVMGIAVVSARAQEPGQLGRMTCRPTEIRRPDPGNDQHFHAAASRLVAAEARVDQLADVPDRGPLRPNHERDAVELSCWCCRASLFGAPADENYCASCSFGQCDTCGEES